ncbi:DUF4247 domain-containing protein [Pseudonocardia parietis]|uniref:DUF4247 domain-containing protein n=1 Tax=Pseudonocardia parietis TaxID=570936 RepID=A0ABS4VTB9_9PSEU|nr:DUF4247 domain-containing protein [Pseudonocardia parietis]MBP2367175.1 hypothetical protein [Pseudonocardia parietis]
MSGRVRAGTRLACVLLVCALLGGCGIGTDVRDVIEDRYPLQQRTGDTAVYTSNEPVSSTAAAIAGAVRPAARSTDRGAEYLRYDDDIVIVSPAPAGSTVQVEDLDGRYRGGAFVFLGPGFRPGSPAAGGFGGGPGGIK